MRVEESGLKVDELGSWSRVLGLPAAVPAPAAAAAAVAPSPAAAAAAAAAAAEGEGISLSERQHREFQRASAP